MSTISKIDPSTLSWVKAEIDESLKQAHIALESFSENPSDDTRLRFCVTHLHQVVGTLQMVELDGAAMLARETEALADAVLSERVPGNEGNLELLSRAILLLPDYLAELQFGRPDSPLRLLPLMNELRAGHGAAALAEEELFTPDLSVRPPRAAEAHKPSEGEYVETAAKLRPKLQSALLGYLRDTGDTKALASITSAVESLQQSAPIGVIEQLFWVAGGLLEALQTGGLDATNERKKLVARLDQQIKRLIDGGDKTALRTSSEALIRSMLFQIGTASSGGPKVTQLRRAFALEMLLGRPALDGGQAATERPEPKTIESVASALGEEVHAAQELLSNYFDPDQKEVSSLAPLVEQLRRFSATVELLGIPPLQALVDRLLEVTSAVVDGKLEANDEVSMRMARALLLIENSARDIWSSGWKKQAEDWARMLQALLSPEQDTPDAGGIEVGEVGEAEFGELVSVVAAEITVSLGKIEEAIEEFAADTDRPQLLDEVPAQLTQVQGALQMLGEERPFALASLISERVQDIRSGALVPSKPVLEALAVGVGTLSAYAEGLRHGRPSIDDLIDAAMNDMQAAATASRIEKLDAAALLAEIVRQLSRWLEDPRDGTALEAAQRGLDDITVLAASEGQDRIARISVETNNLLSVVAEEPTQLTDEVLVTLKRSVEVLVNLVRQQLQGAQAAPEPATLPRAPTRAVPKPGPVSEAVSPQTPLPEPPPAIVAPPPEPVVAAPPPVAPTSASGAPSATAAAGTEIDPEMLEIFIEEAREVLEMINREFPSWRGKPDNAQALLEVRRGFHTLKGSGRMVGASEIGELAWAVEDLLNKVRDRKVAPAEPIFDLVTEVKDILPLMVDELAGGPPPTADIEALRQRAQALANGEPVAAPPRPAPPPVPKAVTPPTTAAVRQAFPRLEPTLLRIFTSETRGHLDTVAREVAKCREAGGSCLVSNTLLRATHTLGGGGRSVGLEPMSRGCGKIEHLLEAMQEAGVPLEGAQLGLLDEMVGCVSDLVEVLNDDERPGEDVEARFFELAARATREIAQLPSLERKEMPLKARHSPPPAEPPPPIAIAAPPPPPEVVVPAAVAPTVAAQGPEEDIDPELVDVFLEEATDLLGTIDEALTQWRDDPSHTQALEDLKRGLHTLKGGARMASAMVVGNLAHSTEDLIRRMEEGKLATEPALFDLLHEVHDTLVMLIEQIRQARPLSSVDGLSTRIARLLRGEPLSALSAAPAADIVSAPRTEHAPALAAGSDEPVAQEEIPGDRRHRAEGADPEPVRGRRDRRGQVRVRTALLTDLVNYAGEVSISRSRMEQQVYGLREHLGELNRNVTRFRDQLRELEIQSDSAILYSVSQAAGHATSTQGFDPLEMDRYSRLQQLSRSLTESLHDLSTIQTGLQVYAGEAETTLQQQARTSTNLQEGLMRTRMISFSTQGARLRHIARQTARELGKQVELQITGVDVGVDRTVLERMMGPFEHMIRNAIDHGIEGAAERQRARKGPVGKIVIDTRQEGTDIVIRLSDDGRGLDTAAIRRRAIERGLLSTETELAEEELVQFILLAGFSTAREVTHLSGRGVGMDVVENEVKQLGGSMSVATARGQGTTFIIRLPVTLSVTQALLINVGEQRFAVPLSAVQNIIEMPGNELKVTAGKNPVISYQDKVYSYMHLGARLGISPTAPRNGAKVALLLARVGARDVALQVDSLIGTREIVVKPLGAQLAELKGLSGATILGDGTVLLILDVGGLWLTDQGMQVEHVDATAPAPAPVASEAVPTRPIVMVVDDSLTVRKVTGRHLQKRGFDVLTAKDGLDALEQLHERTADVMLVDIEMPRMDGYELTSRVRADARLQHIPIIIITSRAGDKHRNRAFELGVNLYMTKPYQEDDLLENIKTLLPQAALH